MDDDQLTPNKIVVLLAMLLLWPVLALLSFVAKARAGTTGA
jgi:hypothetical protein